MLLFSSYYFQGLTESLDFTLNVILYTFCVNIYIDVKNMNRKNMSTLILLVVILVIVRPILK